MDPIVNLVTYSCGGASSHDMAYVISEFKELQIFKASVVLLVTYGITKKISIALIAGILWYIHIRMNAHLFQTDECLPDSNGLTDGNSGNA